MFVPLRLKDQPLDFACKLSSFAALRRLTDGGPEAAIPPLRFLSCDHLCLAYMSETVPDSASEGALVFPHTGGDGNDRETAA